MSGYDYIQRGSGGMVLGDVRCTLDRQGMGMDWRWESGNSRTATTSESTSLPYSTFSVLGHVGTV